MDNHLLSHAIAIATEAHKGQKDKYGQEYLHHPIRVMNMGRNLKERIVGILHDVVEDTEWTFEDLEKKMETGAEYAVTQLFYDNRKYFDFVERARKAGVTIPIIPGIKPFKKLSQLSMIPKTFKVDLPEELTNEILKCKNDAEAQQVGIEWCVQQCKELMKHHIPSIHFYSIGAVDSIKEVAKQIY